MQDDLRAGKDTKRSDGEQGIERRRVLTRLPAFVSLLVWGWSACKPEKKDHRENPSEGSGSSTGQARGGEETGPAVLPGPLSRGGAEATKACAAGSNTIDLSKIPQAGRNLSEPLLKFYGDSASTMVVLAIPAYQHGNLLEIFLARPNGQLIAQKGIVDPTDIFPDSTLRPVVFDNIQLKSDRLLTVVFKVKCSDCVGGFDFGKVEMKQSIAFDNKFLGKPVYSLAPSSLPGNLTKNAVSPSFGPDPTRKEGYRDDGAMSLLASDEAVYLPAPELKACVVTDLMGRVITEQGETFNDIVNYPRFICYKLVDNAFYIRTFVRLA